MPSISAPAAIVGGAAIGAGAQIYSASQGASAQESAANSANNIQEQMFEQTQANISPYLQVGQAAATDITNAAGLNTDNPLTSALLKPIVMDQATLEQTPGYQFEKQQGLEAVTNANSATGGAVGGAQQKAAIQYAEGLASGNYQQQFNNAVTNQTNQFNRLQSLVGTGQASAVGQGQISANVASNIGNNIVGAGNAAAASDIATGNAITGGINNALSYNYLNQALNPTGVNSASYEANNAAYNGLSAPDLNVPLPL
jgi:hypothetical protein